MENAKNVIKKYIDYTRKEKTKIEQSDASLGARIKIDTLSGYGRIIDEYKTYLNILNNNRQYKCNIFTRFFRSEYYGDAYLKGSPFKDEKPDDINIIVRKCKKCGGLHCVIKNK